MSSDIQEGDQAADEVRDAMQGVGDSDGIETVGVTDVRKSALRRINVLTASARAPEDHS